jgi:hypothetical protein
MTTGGDINAPHSPPAPFPRPAPSPLFCNTYIASYHPPPPSIFLTALPHGMPCQQSKVLLWRWVRGLLGLAKEREGKKILRQWIVIQERRPDDQYMALFVFVSRWKNIDDLSFDTRCDLPWGIPSPPPPM